MRTISVLIPTYNAEKHICQLLNGITNQRLNESGRLEIIIVDSSSTDKTIKNVINNFPGVKVFVIDNKDFDHGGTRNYLASLASGEYLLFMTQDAIPFDNNLIINLISEFEDNRVDIVYARQIPKPDASPIEVFLREFNYPDKRIVKDKNCLKELGIKTFFNSNVCSMYRRSTFNSLGGFPENIILNEDMVLAAKVILNGNKVVYNNKAKVFHSHNYTLPQQFKRYFDIGMAFEQTKYLQKYASNEREGFKFFINLLGYLIKNKKINKLPYAFVETLCKYIAYILGRKHYYLPKQIKVRLSAYTRKE
ncbi:rhamnosyltransferase [Caldalkalibacillus uzonensis]|uniref:Rhamnosyltransferase n=1 Tax=Caldalkalibacillus uzonensis TaxID=353224 RepID=A0ABU0CSR2_9BACI|nr:glycosyltransferase [Caldalkalibacillus uzonensis]MDQ0339460.1 rhamnosyltransferase [Caldalkalibacillus uzonensis]